MISFLNEGLITTGLSKLKTIPGIIATSIPTLATYAVIDRYIVEPTTKFQDMYKDHMNNKEEQMTGIMNPHRYEDKFGSLIDKQNTYIANLGDKITPEMKQQMVSNVQDLNDQLKNNKVTDYSAFNKTIDDLEKKYTPQMDTQTQQPQAQGSFMDQAGNFISDNAGMIGAGLGVGALVGGAMYLKNRFNKKNTQQNFIN